MKKKTEYSNMVVMMAIFLLALPIALPPFFRAMFPKEEVEVVKEKQVLLMCRKDVSTTEGYNVSSSTIYKNDVPEKNTISFLIVTPNSGDDSAEVQENMIVEPNVVQQNVEEGTTTGENTSTGQRTVNEEISFFRGLEGVNFSENETSIVVTINGDSLSLNSDNLELSSYLSSLNSQKEFYTNMGYSCYTEDF